MEHIIVCRDENLYCAFPDIVKLQNGELLVGFREAPRRKIISHHDPKSRAVFVRSKDNGKTWGEKTVIYQDEDGVQDPSIMQLKDGTVFSNFFKWRFRETKEELGELELKRDVSSLGFPEGGWTAIVGTFVVRSFDNGKTWNEPPVQINFPLYKGIATSAPILECNDGTILLPLYYRPAFEGVVMTSFFHSFVIRSFNKGRTWKEPALAGADPERKIAVGEPTLLQLKSGKIICMMRTCVEGDDYLRQTESFDNGKTWAKFWKTPIIGHPPHLLQLSHPQQSCGYPRTLCSYGYRHKPFGIRACLSNDEGKTWDLEHEIIIRDDGMHTDLGYPSSVEIEPGKILTVYYFHDKSETRFIAGTFYNI